jgi:uncharacterized protein (TIGR02246 family)
MNTEENSIAAVLSAYEDALNKSDTEAVMKLYAPDAVFMPQNFPSSLGAESIRKAYKDIFNAITLAVKFKVEEVHQMAEDWAFARTNSAGTVKIHATGDGGPEANQELFVFQKLAGSWKIARYCFSTTKPPRA